jgi:hypothetical protein
VRQCEATADEDDPSPIEAATAAQLAVAETKEAIYKSEPQDPIRTVKDDDEILWLARVIYSESKRAEEERLVAWTVRNRVETGYRGNETYQDAALDPKQYSGLNKGDAQYKINISRTYASTGKAWQQAVAIAHEVYYAPSTERPFSVTVRHFYSPISVTHDPEWASEERAVEKVVDPHTKSVRFAFYDGVE